MCNENAYKMRSALASGTQPSPVARPGPAQTALQKFAGQCGSPASPAHPAQPAPSPTQPSSEPSPAQPAKKNLLKTFEFPQALNNFSAMMPVPVSSANSTHCPAQAAADTRLIALSQETTRQVYVRIMLNHMRCKKA